MKAEIRRGIVGILAALVVWELGAQLDAPLLGPVGPPPPTDVARSPTSSRGGRLLDAAGS